MKINELVKDLKHLERFQRDYLLQLQALPYLKMLFILRVYYHYFLFVLWPLSIFLKIILALGVVFLKLVG
jgi:hypothetical protein